MSELWEGCTSRPWHLAADTQCGRHLRKADGNKAVPQELQELVPSEAQNCWTLLFGSGPFQGALMNGKGVGKARGQLRGPKRSSWLRSLWHVPSPRHMSTTRSHEMACDAPALRTNAPHCVGANANRPTGVCTILSNGTVWVVAGVPPEKQQFLELGVPAHTVCRPAAQIQPKVKMCVQLYLKPTLRQMRHMGQMRHMKQMRRMALLHCGTRVPFDRLPEGTDQQCGQTLRKIDRV